MSPRYSPQVSRTSNLILYPATCVRRHYMYPDTSCLSGIHVSGRRVSWCKRGISHLSRLRALLDNRTDYKYLRDALSYATRYESAAGGRFYLSISIDVCISATLLIKTFGNFSSCR